MNGQAADNRFTCRSFLCCSACHKSNWDCWLSQLSAEVSKAMESRIAISGLIPERPFRMAEWISKSQFTNAIASLMRWLAVPFGYAKKQRFKSTRQAQQFLSFHGVLNNLFRQQRHLMSAKNYRTLRDRAFAIWQQDTCACWTESVWFDSTKQPIDALHPLSWQYPNQCLPDG